MVCVRANRYKIYRNAIWIEGGGGYVVPLKTYTIKLCYDQNYQSPYIFSV